MPLNATKESEILKNLRKLGMPYQAPDTTDAFRSSKINPPPALPILLTTQAPHPSPHPLDSNKRKTQGVCPTASRLKNPFSNPKNARHTALSWKRNTQDPLKRLAKCFATHRDGRKQYETTDRQEYKHK
ncbi:hypothetical protein B0T16DRAFT_234407 [Cercophora newfieldiana]|uniref:Uncharacterized protein n=1 Tax=Cercophora newfieldiana TaxID=92897 RepID=A0AA39XRI6_9PEZI|nr:hypothetical protein B0T16DRAFT_234407 [Cercophora newfieldiana]